LGAAPTGEARASAAGRGRLPGAGDAEARGCWAGRGWAGAERAAGLLARSWAERERGGLGRWLWCWAAGKEMAMGPNERKGRNGRNFPFSFYK